jgi:hypothetical protein
MDLLAFGFREVGAWSLDPSLGGGVRFDLTAHGDERVVYAFAVKGTIKYIGVCDDAGTTLRERLTRYQSRAGAVTNERIVGLVQQELRAARPARILARTPDRVLEVGGLEIDLVKGLENPLIHAVRPEWNIRR